MKRVFSIILSFFILICVAPIYSNASTSENFEYNLLYDGTVIITNYNGSDSEINIPQRIDDRIVTSIGPYAFDNCTDLKRITIPNSVTDIFHYAFLGCVNLETIALPTSSIYIASNAFDNTNFFNDKNNWRDYALYIGEHLIKVDSSITGAFSIKEGTLDIAGSAFRNCDKLLDISIPDSVINICDYAFCGCKGIENIRIPESVENIYATVFMDCTALKTINLHNNVSIGQSAFENCVSLSNISITNKIEQIYDNAFYNCTCLKDVYYSGSEVEWNQMIIGKNNESLLNANIHYNNDGETSFSVLDSCLQSNSSIYDNDLALISAELSNATYNGDGDSEVRRYLIDKGFDDKNIISNNYGGSLAFTVATKRFLSEENTDLLVILAQGSTNPYELFNDSFSPADKSYHGYHVYGIVNDFKNAIQEKLNGIIDNKKNYKILLTGHSLGGAGVNLLGAMLTDKYGQNNVFCYTFGAINSIVNNHTVSEGYGNIHNIYNELDTFSPYQYGGVMKNGAGKKFGKFGHLDAFVKENRAEDDKHKDPIVQCADHINHDMDKYLAAVKDGIVQNSLLRSCGKVMKGYSIIACPVDVEVYQDNNLVGRVVDNEIDDSVTRIDIGVTDDIKVLLFPDNKEYKIKIKANNDGEMSYYTQDYNEPNQQSIISNVSLEKGKSFKSEVGGSINTEDVALHTIDNNENCLTEVLSDGTEVNPIIMNKNDIELVTGDTFTLTVESVDEYNWYSTDENVVTVENGTVTTKSDGNAKIIAETVNGARAICSVSIVDYNGILGDVNKDGKVSIKDVTTIQLSLANRIVLDKAQQKAADVNCDNVTNIDDCTNIQLYLVGLIQSLPVESTG